MAADLFVAARVLHHDDGTFTIHCLFADYIQYVATVFEASS